MRRVRVAAMLLILSLAGACSIDPEPIEESPTPIAESNSPGPSTTEPASSPGAAGSTAATAAKLTSPEESAKHLYDAWKNGDKALAAKFAEPAAVEDVFSRPYSGPDPEFMGCDHEVDHYFCRYRYEGGSTTYRVDGGVSAGYFVTEVTQLAD